MALYLAVSSQSPELSQYFFSYIETPRFNEGVGVGVRKDCERLSLRASVDGIQMSPTL
jgi:hypothetical protein